VVSLLLALQWGGNAKPWNSGDVIACLVVAGVLVIIFVGWEHYIGPEKAMLPLHLATNRTVWGSSLSAFFLSMAMLSGLYYLPLWYQAVRGVSASRSGIDILSFMMAVVSGAGISGAVIRRTGRYWPWLSFAPLTSAIGSGFLFTIHPSTANSKIIGLQFLTGFGIGTAFQVSKLSVQGEYAYQPHLIAQGTAMVNFTQTMGGVFGISIGGTVFLNKLTSILKNTPGLTSEQILLVRSSVLAIAKLPANVMPAVISAYSDALNDVFIIGVPVIVLGAFAGMVTRNHNLIERSAARPQAKMTEKEMEPEMV